MFEKIVILKFKALYAQESETTMVHIERDLVLVKEPTGEVYKARITADQILSLGLDKGKEIEVILSD